jgi:hypothetical protein
VAALVMLGERASARHEACYDRDGLEVDGACG